MIGNFEFLRRAAVVSGAALLVVPFVPVAPANAQTDPVAYWELDEGSGTTATDSAGNNDGSIVGATYSTNAAPAAGSTRSLSFDGSDDFVDVPDTSGDLDFPDATAMSISLWVFRTSEGATQHILGKRAGCTAGTDFNYQMVHTSEGLSFGPPVGPAVAEKGLALNQWTHVAMTSDGSALRIYLDGELEGELEGTTLGPANDSSLRLGTSGTCHESGQGFGGLLDDVQVYDRALDGFEISQLAQPPPSLSINDVTVSEATANATFTVTMTDVAEATVDFDTTEGTATEPEDFTDSSGTLTFTGGDTSEQVSVPIVNDGTDEGDETFTVGLSNPTGAAIADSDGLGTITDDDEEEEEQGPVVNAAADRSFVERDEDGTRVVLFVTIAPVSVEPIVLPIGYSDGTATRANSDYSGPESESITVPAGASSAEVTQYSFIDADPIPEPDEFYTLDLGDPANASLGDAQTKITIVDDDAGNPTKCPGLGTVPGVHLVGTAGNDSFVGTEGDDVMCGLGGQDSLRGLEGNDRIIGGGGYDYLYGGDGIDRIKGDDGGDSLHGGKGEDELRGGDGDDGLFGGDDDDIVEAGGGDDAVFGDAGDDELFGQAGPDRLFDGPGADVLWGYSGDDKFHLRKDDDADIFRGGEGFDLATFGGEEDLRVSLDGRANDGVVGSAIDDVDTDIEALEGGRGDDILTIGRVRPGRSRATDNLFIGGAGADKLKAGGGSDTLHGNSVSGYDGSDGPDLLEGGPGDDRLFGGPESDELFGEAGQDELEGGSKDDALFGGVGDDRLLGGNGADQLEGGRGSDVLKGRSGNDDLHGGAHDDSLNGESGDDSLVGDHGLDEHRGETGDDTINARDGRTGELVHGGPGNNDRCRADRRDHIVDCP